MAEKASFEENIRNSFSRAKEHVDLLEKEVKANREFLIKQNKQIEFLLSQISLLLAKNEELKAKLGSSESSIGNEGVYSFIHSFNRHSFTKHAQDMHKEIAVNKALETREKQIEKPVNIYSFKKELEDQFRRLSKQEFMAFLTIYRLSEKDKYLTYAQIAKELNLSEGCIRTYISSLIKKGMPVNKEKYNNKHILLSIKQEFKDLNIQEDLVELYYQVDPTQRKLSDSF